jgi:hypothetical protein
MNNNVIFATICVLAASVLSIGVSIPALAQENSTMANSTSGNTTEQGLETNPESSMAPEMEVNGTSMVVNGTNATTTTPADANATFG